MSREESGPKIFRLVGAIFALVAVILLAVCAVTVVSTRGFLADSRAADGEVVALVPGQTCDRNGCDTGYAPRIRFTTAEGREVAFTSNLSSNPPAYLVGDRVPLRYRPSDPAGARIDSWVDLWLASLITGVLGVIFVGVGVLLLVLGRRVGAPTVATTSSRPPAMDREPGNPFLQ